MGDPYALLAELNTYMAIEQDLYDDVLAKALDAASRDIETHRNRQFSKDVTATSRKFDANDQSWTDVDAGPRCVR
ncbi:hypothetical protein [Streptomyces sp. NPDC007100]|uniref:hypothetical protein n=1 Tax=Streptomyces sp. NPDC007100 TaxID=3155602 RepID=UPI0033DC29B2